MTSKNIKRGNNKMSETTDKINKLAIQHKIIGTKTDCPYSIGNLCSRVENGTMRCDEHLECEFKYIDALKEENEKLKQENMGMKRSFVDIIDKVREENYRYYKVLKEINAICTEKYYIADGMADIWDTAIGDFAEQIRKRINEVLNGN